MATDYAKLTKNVLKVSGSPADLYAYALGANATSSPQDWLDAAVNYVKFVDAFLSLVNKYLLKPAGKPPAAWVCCLQRLLRGYAVCP